MVYTTPNLINKWLIYVKNIEVYEPTKNNLSYDDVLQHVEYHVNDLKYRDQNELPKKPYYIVKIVNNL